MMPGDKRGERIVNNILIIINALVTVWIAGDAIRKDMQKPERPTTGDGSSRESSSSPPLRDTGVQRIGAKCVQCEYTIAVERDMPGAIDALRAAMAKHEREEHNAQPPDYASAKDDDLQDVLQCRHCGQYRADREAIAAHLDTQHGIKEPVHP